MRIERQQDERAESWTDQEVVQRMRRDDDVATREFYRRFAPALWKEARRAHVQPALRDDVVNDCLADSATANVAVALKEANLLVDLKELSPREGWLYFAASFDPQTVPSAQVRATMIAGGAELLEGPP